MNAKIYYIIIFVFALSLKANSQNYSLGDFVFPTSYDFEKIGYNPKTKVTLYRYLKPIKERFFGRVLGDIVLGLKDNHVAQTVYLMIPESTDYGVPSDIVNLIQNNLPFPLTKKNGVYGVKIDNYNITISRNNDAITFYKDRIMYFSSINQKTLEKR